MVEKALRKIKRKTARVIVKQRIHYRRLISSETEKKRRKRLSTLLLIVAAVLLIVPGIVCLRHKLLNTTLTTNEVSENQELFYIATLIYRHYIGYADYCKKQGVLLQNYPKEFYQAYHNDLLIFGKEAREHGFTPDKILAKTKKEFASVSEKSIQREFKRLIQKRFQDETGAVVQTEENLCKTLDKNPALWMKNHENGLAPLREFSQKVQ